MNQPRIFLDADACPVKDYVYRVAARYRIPLRVVANARLRIPSLDGLRAETILVAGSPDAADDWIVEHVSRGDIVLTADIPLAARVIGNDVDAIDFRGNAYNPNRIGDALASREINAHLRSMGVITSGPSAMSRTETSAFASRLDAVVNKMRREFDRLQPESP